MQPRTLSIHYKGRTFGYSDREWTRLMNILDALLQALPAGINYKPIASILMQAAAPAIATFRTHYRDQKLYYLLGDVLERNWVADRPLQADKVWNKKLKKPGPGFDERLALIIANWRRNPTK